MKRSVVLLVVLCALLPSLFGQGLDDEYVQIFRLIQEADSLSTSAPNQALAKYLDARAALDRLHKGSPEWNTRIVNYRLNYLDDRISAISPNSTAAQSASAGTNQPATSTPAKESAPAKPATDWRAEAAGLQQRLGQLSSDNALLQAKLKEALAMRPAAADPAELAKAQDRIRTLEKENELLKLSRQKDAQNLLDKPTSDQSSKALAEAQKQLSEQSARYAKLSLEKEALEARLKNLSQPAPQKSTAADTTQLKQLQAERDELQKRLDAANRDLNSRRRKRGPAASPSAETELAATRARLEILEARATPYTAEELELLKRPEAKLTETNARTGKKSVRELPEGARAQAEEAQRYFAAKQYDRAEQAYAQVLKLDPKNVPALGNLAAIQAEAGHLDQAESNIQQALALDPEDSYSLYVLGILRFRQGKYDDALGALSRSAKLDPQNAEVQNYLGLALSEKGMRTPAEAALRKAIQLQPGYAGAHYNLAVVYATQQPPATELARFHYEKAVSAGHPRNPELEKRFETRQ